MKLLIGLLLAIIILLTVAGWGDVPDATTIAIDEPDQEAIR